MKKLMDDGELKITLSHDDTLRPLLLRIYAPDDTKIFETKFAYDHISGTEHGPYNLQAGSYVIYLNNSWYRGGEGNYTMVSDVKFPDFPNDNEPNDSKIAILAL
jgi:hypothetical protein